jgi:hypothetical protein
MAMRLMLPVLACLGGTTVPATHGDDPSPCRSDQYRAHSGVF